MFLRDEASLQTGMQLFVCGLSGQHLEASIMKTSLQAWQVL